MMKKSNLKLTALFLGALIAAFMFAGCGSKADSHENRLKIVTTVFPVYDWTKNVVGSDKNDIDITILLDKGTDLHSYQPTAQDIAKIAGCDVFVYVGGESDKWIEDVLDDADNYKMVVINLIDKLGDNVVSEEFREGMQTAEHHDEHDRGHYTGKNCDQDDCDHDADEHKDGTHNYHGVDEADEHIWLSLKNAKLATQTIADEIAKADPKNKNSYMDNAKSYIKSLDSLDKNYKTMVEKSRKKTVLFADRFPFRYLVEDYGLEYFAAFSGCSAESEASFKTVKFLAEKADRLRLNAILVIENSNRDIAKAVIGNTKDKNKKILTMNSMQSINAGDVESGATYIKIMEDNLKVLKEALN